jgi:hypothetical protein
VISVDGMPAHLAGTLGRPTWLLLKHDADWRWMEDREDTPWYPAMRLFRQARAGDWASPINAVVAALAAMRKAGQVTLSDSSLDQPAPRASRLMEAGAMSNRSR